MKRLQLPQGNKPEEPEKPDAPQPEPAPQKAPASPNIIAAMNSQTGANVLSALNRAQLTIGGTIAARIAGGPAGVAGNGWTRGTGGPAGFGGGVGGTGGFVDFGGTAATIREGKVDFGNKITLDKLVSTDKQETKYDNGNIKSETTTKKYASGKTVVIEKEYDENGELITDLTTTITTNSEGNQEVHEQKQGYQTFEGKRIEFTKDITTTTYPDGSEKKVGFETDSSQGWFDPESGKSGPTIKRIDYFEDGSTKRIDTSYVKDPVTGELTLHSESTTITDADGNSYSEYKLYREDGKTLQQYSTYKNNADGSYIGTMLVYSEGFDEPTTNFTETRGKDDDKLKTVGYATKNGVEWNDENGNHGYSLIREDFYEDGSQKITSTKYYAETKIPYSKTETFIDPEGNTEKIIETIYNRDGSIASETIKDKDEV